MRATFDRPVPSERSDRVRDLLRARLMEQVAHRAGLTVDDPVVAAFGVHPRDVFVDGYVGPDGHWIVDAVDDRRRGIS